MSITGPADGEPGGGPTKVGVAISDVLTGLNGAVAILAALVGREPRRRRPLHGDRRPAHRPDLLGSTLAAARQPGPERVRRRRVAGPARQRPPEHRPVRDVRDGRRRRSPSRSAASGSGRGSAARSGCPALADDPRFATNGDRVANRAELIPTLAERFAEQARRRLAGGARRGRGPGRPDQRHRRRLRLAVGGRPDRRGSSIRCSARRRRWLRRSTCPRRRPRSGPRRRSSASTPDEILAELGYDAAREIERRCRSAGIV